MLSGKVTGLRAIEPDDLEQLRLWRNIPNFRRHFRESRELSRAQQQNWYDKIVLGDPNTRMFAITALEDGRLLGACGLCYIDWMRRSADFSFYIGDGDAYIDDIYAPDAGRVLINHGFLTLGLHRLWCEIYAFDDKKKAFLPSLGFQLDGRHRDHHFEDGRFHDSLFYGLLSTDDRPA